MPQAREGGCFLTGFLLPSCLFEQDTKSHCSLAGMILPMELDPTERMNPMNTVPPSSPRTRRESFADGLTVRIDEQGSGRPMLLLHGGGGPQTMFGLAS